MLKLSASEYELAFAELLDDVLALEREEGFPEEKAGSTLRRRLGPGRPDDFQTPPGACDALFEFLPRDRIVWEPACGKGNICRACVLAGHAVIGTDILSGYDFLSVSVDCDVIITNPPYSQKDAFLARAYAIGKPFAFLLPFTAFEGQARQALFREYGVQVIFLPTRVNFETPSGKPGSAWFPTAWFTHGLNLPADIIFWQPGVSSAVPGGSSAVAEPNGAIETGLFEAEKAEES